MKIKKMFLKSECDKYAPEETTDAVDDNTGTMDTDTTTMASGLESTTPFESKPLEATPFQPVLVNQDEATSSQFGAPQPVTTSPFEPKPAFGTPAPSPFEPKPAFGTPAPSPFVTRGFGGKRRYKSKKNLNKRSRQTRKKRGGNKTPTTTKI
jgi:ABC-type uncharacterized transport system involved in gliding motility auxiliary subunit